MLRSLLGSLGIHAAALAVGLFWIASSGDPSLPERVSAATQTWFLRVEPVSPGPLLPRGLGGPLAAGLPGDEARALERMPAPERASEPRRAQVAARAGIAESPARSAKSPVAAPARGPRVGSPASGRARAGAIPPARGEAAPEAAAAGSDPAARDLRSRYLGELRARIESRKLAHYPLQARRLGQAGTVEVTFRLESDGRFSGARVSRSSAQPALDEGALALIREVGRFKPIPRELALTAWDLTLPITFEIR